jgi:hypothetical protein
LVSGTKTCPFVVGGTLVKRIGVAMLGYGFMGIAHSRALVAVRQLGAALEPELV